MPSRSEVDNYVENERLFILENNLSVGSRVFINRIAEGGELGWNNSWNSSAMDRTVNTSKTIVSFNTSGIGIRLDNDLYYPYFILVPEFPEEEGHTLILDGDEIDITQREYEILRDVFFSIRR